MARALGKKLCQCGTQMTLGLPTLPQRKKLCQRIGYGKACLSLPLRQRPHQQVHPLLKYSWHTPADKVAGEGRQLINSNLKSDPVIRSFQRATVNHPVGFPFTLHRVRKKA